MGKSHLALDFQDYLGAGGWRVYRGHCYSHTVGNPFAPWIHILSSFFDIGPGDGTEARTEKALAALKRLSPDLVETAPLLNALLMLSIPQTDVVRSLDDETRRRRLFELVAELLQAAAADSPVAVLLEDLHWADHSSLQLVNYIATSLGPSRLLLCLTHRPEEGLALDLPSASTLTITLGELPEDAALKLVRTVLDLPELAAEVAEAILSKARGNPLFLEEVARSIRESGALDRVLSAPSFRLAEELAALDISDRIQALIMSRIDALSAGTREVLRVAAVIGSTFDFPTLRSILGRDREDTDLDARLQELVQLDHVNREQGIEEPSYRFKHALIQEIAYDSLLFARRRELHHQVATYLEGTRGEQLEPLYEALVHHYGRSGDGPKTLVYALKAGDKARQVFANEEAVDYYRRGLAVLEEMGGPVAYQRSYLLERIGDCYEVSGRHGEAARTLSQALRGWRKAARQPAAPSAMPLDLAEGPPAKTREAVLCRKLGVSYERKSDYDSSLKWLESALRALPPRQPLQAAQITVAKSVSLFRKGLYEEAIRCGRLGLTLSWRSGERHQLAYAHNMLANPYVEVGNLKQAARHLRSAVRFYHEVGDLPGQAAANNNLGVCYQNLGVLGAALHHLQVALQVDQRIGNAVHAAIEHNNIGEVLLTQGRLDEAVGHFLKVVETYERAGDPLAASGLALVNLSRAYQRQHYYKRASERLQQGIGLLRKAGARGLLTEAYLQQAELELETGRTESALRTCGRALRESRELGTKLLEARGLRVLGRIALVRGRHTQAEADLRQSAALADRLGADYEKGLALLYLAEVYASQAQEKGFHRRCGLALRQARAIFRRLGAERDLSRTERMQADLGW